VASNRRWKSILCARGQEIEELESADAYVLLFAGYLTFASGEPKSAASFLLEAVKDSTLLPQEYVLDAKNLLGQILFMEGKTDGAVRLLGDIITDSQTALSLTHAITLSALRSLGFAHFKYGEQGSSGTGTRNRSRGTAQHSWVCKYTYSLHCRQTFWLLS